MVAPSIRRRSVTRGLVAPFLAVVLAAGCGDGVGGRLGVHPPKITTHPADRTVTEGETATFTVTATGGGLTYQWKKDGVDIAGATTASYTTPATILADDGAWFRCVVTNAAGSATSNAATLTVRPHLDFNGDGFGDVIVGARYDDDGGGNSGCAFVFFGSASPPSVIDASAADVKLVGEDGSDSFGYSVSSAGDVNGDGFGDVIVGAYWDDDGGSDSGCAFIFFGSASPPSVIDASAADVKLVGADAGDRFGWSVSAAGDVNGDGFGDVIVGARWDDDGGDYSGCAFVFFGSASPPLVIDASAADVKLVGEDASDAFGCSVSAAGDVNGDGFGDVIVGARLDDDGGDGSGCAFVFFGSASPPSLIDASAADVKLVGGDSGDYFGISGSSAGDVNGDGVGDVIVGAYGDDDGGADSGCAFVFFGSASPPSVIDASEADVKLVGGDASDLFGYSVSAAGDVNGDGFGDVIVGAEEDDDGGTDSGCAFIFFGSASPPSVIDASAADVKLVGGDAVDFFGRSVSSAGDVNGDGFSDVIVGADGGDGAGLTEERCCSVAWGDYDNHGHLGLALAGQDASLNPDQQGLP